MIMTRIIKYGMTNDNNKLQTPFQKYMQLQRVASGVILFWEYQASKIFPENDTFLTYAKRSARILWLKVHDTEMITPIVKAVRQINPKSVDEYDEATVERRKNSALIKDNQHGLEDAVVGYAESYHLLSDDVLNELIVRCEGALRMYEGLVKTTLYLSDIYGKASSEHDPLRVSPTTSISEYFEENQIDNAINWQQDTKAFKANLSGAIFSLAAVLERCFVDDKKTKKQKHETEKAIADNCGAHVSETAISMSSKFEVANNSGINNNHVTSTISALRRMADKARNSESIADYVDECGTSLGHRPLDNWLRYIRPLEQTIRLLKEIEGQGEYEISGALDAAKNLLGLLSEKKGRVIGQSIRHL